MQLHLNGLMLTFSSALRQLEGFVRTVIKFTKLPSICNKMVVICSLECLFDSFDSPTGTGVSDPLPMLALAKYVRNYCSKVSCFDDIKPFVERLDHANKMQLAANLSKLSLEEVCTLMPIHDSALTRMTVAG